MPILDVSIVLMPEEIPGPGLAAAIAEAAAEVFQTAPGSTWVKLTLLPAEHYAEDHGGPPQGVYPVFVHVLKLFFDEP